MACVLMPQCDFLYCYFWCQLPEDTINMEVTLGTMMGIHTFKRDHVGQIISCRPWSLPLHPHSSMAIKMRTYLELKDHIADPLHSNPTYPDRPNTPPPQKLQSSRKRMMREAKKRNKNHQVGSRQYKVRRIEKPLLLSRSSATSAPRTAATTTTTTTLPTMSKPATATTTWPSTTSTTSNIFVSNSSNTLKTPHIPYPQIPNQTPGLWQRPYTPEHLLSGPLKTIVIEQTKKREKISRFQRREWRWLAEGERTRREEQNTASPKSNAPGPSHKEYTPISALEK